MGQQLNTAPSIQLLPNAALADLVAPTFSGITSLVANNDGSLTAGWGSASDLTPPIDFLIYIAVGIVTAGSLFQASNLVSISPAGTSNRKIFTLANQTTYLVKDQVYTVGVRARDAVGNVNQNTAIATATAISTGNLAGVFQTLADAFGDLNAAYDALNTTHDSLNDDQSQNNTDQDALNTTYGNLNAEHSTLNDEQAQNNTDQQALNTELETNIDNLNSEIAELDAITDGLDSSVQAITAGAGTQMSFETTETVMTVETDGVE